MKHEDEVPVVGEASGTTRRRFLGATVRGCVTVGVGAGAFGCSGRDGGVRDGGADSPGGVPRRVLGKTGLEVSIVGLGGYHIGIQKDPAESVRIIQGAIDGGINFFDNSNDYNEGQSEIRVGEATQGRRDQVVLMTKFNSRDKKGAMLELEESLRRLRTDVIDVWQFHSMERIEDPDWIFTLHGAIEAVDLAKRQGKVRFVGFTGHKHPDIHLKMLAQPYDWDTIQMPLNILDAHFRSFGHSVLPEAVRMNLGIIGMKPLAFQGALKVAGAVECLHYAMSLPVSTTLTGCETEERLEQALLAARTFRPMVPTAMEALLARSKELGSSGEGEPFKRTTDFDNKPPASPPPYGA
jgi:predicted aldo/keto reductase-like oxidoreductase